MKIAGLKSLKMQLSLPAKDYQLLHSEYGKYLGEKVNRFIEKNQLNTR